MPSPAGGLMILALAALATCVLLCLTRVYDLSALAYLMCCHSCDGGGVFMMAREHDRHANRQAHGRPGNGRLPPARQVLRRGERQRVRRV